MSGLASLTVVTVPGDVATQEVARAHGAAVFATNAFYLDGAAFNKGRAMESARVWAEENVVQREHNWRLFFDSDVVPPEHWNARLRDDDITPGSLYGCLRFDATPSTVEDVGQPKCAYDVPGVGYFQLFHSLDPVVRGTPLLDIHWAHAGNYDNRFMDLWRSRGIRVRAVPFRVAHIGERENWFGRGNRDAFLAMQAERRARGGRWDHEQIPVIL
jgi:hypothetical protein